MSDDERPDVPIRPEAVAPGERAPGFELPAVTTDGERITVSMPAVLEKGPVLLVFYQDDGMPLCTSELKAFAQEHETLVRAGVQVFAVNTNGLGSHGKFQERDRFPFPLISDFYGEAVKAYGMWDADEEKSRRAVVLVGEDGVVRHTIPHFNPGNLNAFEEVFRELGLI